jgi:predicted proteasome-type protease
MYQAGTLKMERKYRFEESSEYLRQVKSAWDQRLKEAFSNMPPLAWSKAWDHSVSESN